mgnify:FL=1
MAEKLFSDLDLDVEVDARAGYRLKYLEVFNWGTFNGQVWRLTPDSETALLTGDIGSGKSTLVDALTTLLLPAHRIAYNKAAGATSRERDLRSYVEGHYKSERIEASGRSRAIGLRSGTRTYSVILGVFVNDGYAEEVTLAQVFQQRESTGQPYRFYVTAKKSLSIAVDFADFGADLRDLRKRLRDSGAEIFDDFPRYGTTLRRALGIRSEQALELFHQTVSMKSVGNLNEFVRDHMLEPSDPTRRVNDIIAHFEDLTKAHNAVKRAREQLQALQPVVQMAAKYDEAIHTRGNLENERSAVELFITELRLSLLTQEIDQFEEVYQRLKVERETEEAAQQSLADERDALIEERARAGGDRVGELERLIREAHAQAEKRGEARRRFEAAVAVAGLPAVVDAQGFAELEATVAEARVRLAGEKRELDAAAANAIGNAKQLEVRREEISGELTSLEQRTSNLPVEQVDVRAHMCADLGLSPQDLPYAGELLDVYEDRAEWRGAAERVLRGFALSLLVPQEHYDKVSTWVNSNRLTFTGSGGRKIGARLTYERVAERRIPLRSDRGPELLLADCLEVKEGTFQAYLLAELSKRADHRCVTSLAEFRREKRAVTREGQVRSGERHEKDDRHRVDDPRRWVLGWANERKISALRSELDEVERALAQAQSQVEAVTGQRERVQAQLEGFARLDSYQSWEDLNDSEPLARASEYEGERSRLVSGSSRLAEIALGLERIEARSIVVRRRVESLTGELATTAKTAEQARSAQRHDREYISTQAAEELALAREAYPDLKNRLDPAPQRSEDCADAKAGLFNELHWRIYSLSKELGGYGQKLVQAMAEVLQRWPEQRADMDASVESRADFLAFHDRVANDDLPRFESEFKDQLNKNAIQELAGFNNWLNRQASAIDERLEHINEALRAVPYNPGRFIRLEKEPTINQDVVQFRADLRNLTNDALVVGGDQYSEQRFLDVKRVIERFRGRDGYTEADKAWTRRVTDVRNWFVFSASERDLDTHEEWEHYSDSDGKSGGQKEKLAYTILAASLAYQFGLEWGVTRSKDFRFAVIDEAFGRGSDASTSYALELFAKLGLQLLIVTPLQKVHIIEPYVKAIGFVDNPDGTNSRLQTMTIEDYRARRDGQPS